MKRPALGIAIGVLAVAVVAGTDSPYIGQDTRDIKALSKQEVADYLDGKGMGHAKAAELNHYPGPRHVLDMSRELALTEAQISQTRQIHDTMKAEAMTPGKLLVEKERELDRQFASGSITPATLQTLLSDIGALQARIRYVHLSAHLRQRPLLTPDQIRKYDQLRGYGKPHHGDHGHSH